jgi:NADH:ubiquinone oxidoreductase subunit F (NADH-binding)
MTARRLLAASGPSLAEHHAEFGPLPTISADSVIEALDQAGLTGRGGGGFATSRKLAAVTGRRPLVIGNGAEGEPLSRKDAVLLARAPHLVLDGLQIAGETIGADRVIMYVSARSAPNVKRAIGERVRAGLDRRAVTVVEAPDSFVAGEESAVVRRVEGGPALPRDKKVLPCVSGVRGRPTLVNNVETLAHVALIARRGPRWFRSVGDRSHPGTILVTLSGGSTSTTVAEIATGTALPDVLARGGVTDPDDVAAVLIGGYHGTWICANELPDIRLSRAGLASVGASAGAGVVHALAVDECGLARTAEIVAYLAEQGAGQCGPCRNGLPRLAGLLDELAFGRVDDGLLDDLRRMLGLVDGRGACRHPDGTVRLVRSALDAFAGDIREHRSGRCTAALAAVHDPRDGSEA